MVALGQQELKLAEKESAMKAGGSKNAKKALRGVGNFIKNKAVEKRKDLEEEALVERGTRMNPTYTPTVVLIL